MATVGRDKVAVITSHIGVLHVDDEPDFANMTATFLERENERIEVATETSASDGLERLADEGVDCIVADYDMPGMDGLEFLEAVREDYPTLPFILFTGKGSEEVASDAISAGVTDYVQKAAGTEQYELLANRIENAVERSRARRRHQRQLDALETAQEGISVLDEDGTFIYVNQACADLYGYDPDDLVGEHWTLIRPDDEIDRFRTEVRPTVTDEGMWHGETIGLRADGSTFVEDHARATTARGEIICATRDITDRKAHERELANRERALREAYEVVTTSDWSVFEQVEALLEIGRDVLGTDYATCSHVNADNGRYVFETVATPPEVDLEGGDTVPLDDLPICERVALTEETLVLRDVEAEAPELVDPAWGISCYIGTPVIVDDETYGTFCFYQTEARPEAFSDWDRMFVELLGDWVGMALSQHRARERLERQNERLNAFTGVVSHELRNPLNVAGGQLELARTDCDSEHLATATDALARSQALIDDLLALAREGERVREMDSVELAAAVEDGWQAVETATATLVVESDRTVRADRSRLQELLENLLRNAVKHGGEDVTVTVGDLDTGFYVADDGPGIPVDERDEVFESGYSTGESGTGFGLSIVNEIAEAHGWEISVTDSADGGARFEVTGVDTAS